MFRDRYTDFWFNDKSSVDFKVWMTNGHDIQTNLSPSFTDKFNSPSYSQSRYYEGTSISNQDLKISCAAIGVTKNEWRAIAEWFSPLATGKLVFDWNPNHYFMVKVGKQPTNTVWSLNRVDNVLGEVYIITFDITFTTTNDWAALGQSAVIGIDVCNPTATTIPFGETSPNSLERYKNDYLIPMMLTRKEYKDTDVISSKTVTVDDKTKPNIIILYGDVNFVYTITDTSINSLNIGDIFLFNGTHYAAISYNKNETGETVVVQYYDNASFKQTLSKDSDGKFKFTLLNCDSNYIYYPNTRNGYNQSITMTNPKQLLISNSGTYDMYPNIYGSIQSFSLKDKYDDIYDIKVQNNVSNNYPIEIDCQSGLSTSLGQIVNSLKTYKGKIFDSNTVSNIMSIPSGRPELIKGILRASHPTEVLIDNTKVELPSYYFKIEINKSLMYARQKNFIVNIFASKPDDLSSQYNVGKYGWNNSSDSDFLATVFKNNILCFNPVIEEKTENGKLMLYIYLIPNIQYSNTGYYGRSGITDAFDKSKNLDKDVLDIDKYVYVSICDTELYEESHNTDGKVSINLQTRDVI